MTPEPTFSGATPVTPARPADPDAAARGAHHPPAAGLIEAGHAARRGDFLARMEHAPADALVTVLQRLCDRGAGCWTPPQTAARSRPATHQHEISLWGLLGAGPTPEEAAVNWRIAALRARGDAE